MSTKKQDNDKTNLRSILIKEMVHADLKFYCNMVGANIKDVTEKAIETFLSSKKPEVEEYIEKRKNNYKNKRT
jgi:hypothetical protein